MDKDQSVIHGEVKADFESVKKVFCENFSERNELGAACAVYHQGEKVVDLWGGHKDKERTIPWEEDTLVLVFSTSKGLCSVAMAVAHSRGYYDYKDRVSDHWKKYGQSGKEAISVRELFNHQAGVAAIDEVLTPKKIASTNNLMNELAAKEPDWEPGKRHGYHAFSLGWYQSELLRWTDPQGRRLGQFFTEEIADPLDVEFYIGLPDDIDEKRVASIKGFNIRSILAVFSRFPSEMLVALMNPWSMTSRAMAPFDMRMPSHLNNSEYLEVEIPAANGVGQIRDIAKVYGLLAIGGDKVGINDRTLQELTAEASSPRGGMKDMVLKMETSYNLGFFKPFKGFDFGSRQAFGTPGVGGSFAFADPERNLGFAYAPNRMDTYVLNDPREYALRKAAIRCIDKQ
jgi:CubicO group peptidase (beta-lactamase class C family)